MGTAMMMIERQVHFGKGRHSRKQIRSGHAPKARTIPDGRVPRISRLMALAIHLQREIDDGRISDHAEIARCGYVTRARVTQIMNLNLLAPDIQEALLHLPRTTHGRDPIRERMIRPICAVPDWRKQRTMWRRIRPRRK